MEQAQPNPWEIDWSQHVGPAPASSPPGLGGQPRLAPLPTPQAPALEINTRTNTAHTNQTIQQGDTAGHNFTDEQTLAQQYHRDPRITNYEAILPVYRAAQGAADNPAGDLDIVNAFAKITDPSTGVREGEAAGVANSGNWQQQVEGALNVLHGGGRLGPDQRQQLLAELARRGTAINRLYNAARADYLASARRYGFDERAVVGTHAAIPFRRELGLDQHPPQNRGDLTFWDDPVRPIPPGGEQFQTDLQRAIAAGTFTSPEQIIAYGANYRTPDGTAHHFDINPQQAAAVLRSVQSGGRFGVAAPTEEPLHGDPNSAAETAGAYARGVTNAGTAGLDHPILAAEDTYAPWGRGGSFQENLWRQNAYDRYNSDNHFTADVLGNLTGAAALPTRAVSEARTAAEGILAAGGTRAEAATAARVAAGRRLAMEGAVYGGVHGASTADGDLTHRIATAAMEIAEGGLAGKLMGRFGPSMVRLPREPLPPLVDPVTGHLNQPLESASPAERVAAGSDHNIDLPMGAATDRGGAIIEKGLDVSPVSAGMMNDARRGTEAQARAAVEGVAANYGNAHGQFEGGQAAQAGARSWIARAQGAAGDPADHGVVGRAYDAIPISPTTDSTLTNTRATLDALTSRFQSNPELAALEQNQQLVRYRDALANGGLSWEDLKALRSEIGNRIGAERFSESPSRHDYRALYAALSEDMRATASAQGPRALRSFERANNLNRDVETRIEQALVPILGSDSQQHPERALQFIQNIARGGRGSSSLNQLEAVQASLTKGGHWNDVASALIRLGGQPADSPGRAFDPGTFVRWYSDLPERARSLLFSEGGRGDLRNALDSFVAVAQRLGATNALRNTSSTTPVKIGFGTVAAASGTTAGLMTHPMATLSALFTAGLGAAANYGIARAWTNPKFVRTVTRLVSQSGNAATVQGRQRILARAARATPEIADALGDVSHRLFGEDQNSP